MLQTPVAHELVGRACLRRRFEHDTKRVENGVVTSAVSDLSLLGGVGFYVQWQDGSVEEARAAHLLI